MSRPDEHKLAAIQTGTVALVAAVCLLGSCLSLVCMCVCKRHVTALAPAPPPSAGAAARRRAPGAAPLTVAVVGHPGGEVGLATRTRPDKKMCAELQHAWAEG